MGLLRYILRKERIYSLLAGFTIIYFTWSFLTSQQIGGIDAMRGERSERGLLNQRIQDQMIISDVTRRKLQIKKVESLPRSSADQYDDDEAHIDTSVRQEKPGDNIAPLIKIVTLSHKVVQPLDQRHQETGPTKKPIEIYGDLPKPRDSAFDERMKFSDLAPEGGNALPNYFIHAERTNRTRRTYGDTIVTYLHHNKAAGSSVKDCLHKVSSVSPRKRIALMDSNGRVSSVRRLKQTPNLYHYYMGGYAFGICEQLNEPCSYFTFVRDPYERVISSYSYCRRAGMDQLCQPGDPWEMSIKDWVLFQGSFLFRQILFRPDFCLMSAPRNALKGTHRGGVPARARSAVPCWYREKVQLEGKLNRTVEDDLIDYVVSNLDKWFAVIGITEEYDTSLAMLEEAYGIPFHSRCSGKKKNVSDYRNLKEKSLANETEQDVFVRETKAELMADEEVRRALRADLRIYERAKQIFELQREKYKQIHDLSDVR